MLVKELDTIAAIATPYGRGGISIIKISGVNAKKLAKKLLKKGRKISDREIFISKIYNKASEEIDTVVILFFKAPHSYTGEDIVEIQGHGGELITEKILKEVLNNGARLAEGGEFTKRAVLNGKLDLIEAESINDLINAKTDSEIIEANKNINGDFSKKVKNIKKKLENILAEIIVFFDYPEDEEIEISELKIRLEKIKEKISELIKESKRKKIIKDGIKIAIIGKPNVGKSSVLNMLLSKNRAIVSKEKGTTRDSIEEEIILSGKRIIFIDTAGIRKGLSNIESEGIRRTKKIIKNADIILQVFDNSLPLSPEDEKIISLTKALKKINLINKSDLDNIININEDSIKISAKKNSGREKIFDAIKLLIKDESLYLKKTINTRIEILLYDAEKELSEAIRKITQNEGIEVVENNIKLAKEKMSEIIGENISEDMIEKIFEDFCIGK
ncbi:MAG: tRNA uridine-5-carboxymethylaminomethyl(34) synthesis GTPase MnmE [Clostridiales Family XIII bacterium]|jgi:tRNA modification GTPase|nr:tRNA uridine-5-carboxymethylaminomethyl(34) synthesis GTPase MnmE [Clostridiales Family XIII bacterium]